MAALSRTTKRARDGAVRVRWAPDPNAPAAVAYAVSTRVGNAVTRNRVRRRLRAIVSELEPSMAGGDYLIGVAPESAAMGFAELSRAVRSAIATVQDLACRP